MRMMDSWFPVSGLRWLLNQGDQFRHGIISPKKAGLFWSGHKPVKGLADAIVLIIFNGSNGNFHSRTNRRAEAV